MGEVEQNSMPIVLNKGIRRHYSTREGPKIIPSILGRIRMLFADACGTQRLFLIISISDRFLVTEDLKLLLYRGPLVDGGSRHVHIILVGLNVGSISFWILIFNDRRQTVK